MAVALRWNKLSCSRDPREWEWLEKSEEGQTRTCDQRQMQKSDHMGPCKSWLTLIPFSEVSTGRYKARYLSGQI